MRSEQDEIQVENVRLRVGGAVPRRRRRSPFHFSLFTFHALLLLPSPAWSQDTPIADNSFLIEEAYNQEAGVVQHISALSRPDGGDAWAYSFTQEWPFQGILHQLSYTVPIQRDAAEGTGLGDLALNYRYQWLGGADAKLHASPRLSVLLPTGSERRGRGSGGFGFQANLPVSVLVRSRLVTHWNAGLTVTPSAKHSMTGAATTTSFNLGASAIWLLRPSFNLMLEAVWLSTESVLGPGLTDRRESLLLNPGVRWAFNFPGGLQIVPGVGYTLGLSREEVDALFLYLSFEHPFRH